MFKTILTSFNMKQPRFLFGAKNIRNVVSVSKVKYWKVPTKHSLKSTNYCAMPLSLGFSVLGFLGLEKEEKLDPEEELIMTMKRAILLTQREEYSKAEQMLHLSLRMAQNQNNQQGITYIYDLMANLAMERGELKKSKTMFINVLQRLLQNGVSEDDLKVIHISLKLAHLEHRLGETESSEIGFNWCLKKLAKSIAAENDSDVVLLSGIAHDWYAQLLLDTNRAKDALAELKLAYKACIDVDGADTDQAIMLLNDLGTACWRAGELDQAEKYLRDAEAQSDKLPNKTHLSVIKANLGMLLLQRGLIDDATVNCEQALNIAKQTDNSDALDQANYCLDELKKFNNAR